MEYFCCVLRRHLIKKFKDVNANALFNSFFGGQPPKKCDNSTCQSFI